MRIATYRHHNARHVGRVSSDGLHLQAFEVSAEIAHFGALRLLESVVAGGQWPALTSQQIAISDVQLEAPMPVPRRNIWCVGRNYHEHAKELSTSVFKDSNTNTQAWPIVFTKVPECVVGPFDAVHLPGAQVSEQIDYEAELAVIIGKGGKNITAANAMQYVFA